MWFNKKSSYFLDTFGKRSRYLNELRSGNTVQYTSDEKSGRTVGAGKEPFDLQCSILESRILMPKIFGGNENANLR